MSKTRKITLENFPNYEITEDGRVWSKYSKRWMRTFENVIKEKKESGKQYYLRIALMNKYGVRKKVMVHRLVGIAFVPNPNSNPFINHKNGNKHDNRVENLEWVSNQENCIHASKNDLLGRKLTNKQVKEIIDKSGLHKDIAKEYNVSRRMVDRIKRKERRFI